MIGAHALYFNLLPLWVQRRSTTSVTADFADCCDNGASMRDSHSALWPKG